MNVKHTLRERVLLTTLFVLLLSVVGATKAYALQFVVTSPSNHELVCEIINNDAKTVRIERHNDYTYNGALVIPATVVYDNVTYTVVEIGSYVFKDQSHLTSVSIPNTVTTIGNESFCNCTGLTGTLTIGENIKSVNSGAFNNTGYSVLNYNAIRMCTNENGDVCNYAAPSPDFNNEENGWLGYCNQLTTINIGEQVEVIPARAFCYCRFVGTLTIPNSVTKIGPNAFFHCQQLTGTLTIPESVLRIGNGAFCFCAGLTGLSFNATNFQGDESCFYGFPSQASGENTWFGSCPLLKTLTIGSNVQTITNYLFQGCHFEGAINIPNSVTTVGSEAFKNCTDITSVTIGEGVTSISGGAFGNCTSLSTVNYNAINCNGFGGHYNTDNNVFYGCTSLTTLSIGNQVEVIPENAFAFCSFTGAINIPNSVTQLGGSAFYKCTHVTSVTIGEGLVNCLGASMEYGMFRGCTSLASVTYNAINCTNWVNYNTWDDCSALNSLTIGSKVQSIPAGIFKDCSFSGSLTLPNTLLTIGDNAFQNCSGFTGDLIIPENVTTIGGNAFNGCSGFTGDLTIGNAVTTIGEYAFQDCSGFTGTLTIGESYSIGSGIWGQQFGYCSGLTTLNYNAINGPVGATDRHCLEGCTSLTTLNIGSNVQVIPERAFMDLNFNNDIVIPNSVTTINYEAFRNCDRIKSITIGEGVTTLAGSAITGCDSLTTVHYNAINCNVGNTSVGNGWLNDCPRATTLTLGEHVQSIFKGAFSRRYGGVSFIGNLVLPNSLQTIGEEAFLDCTGLTGNLVIPNSVTSIGKRAFSGCTGFTGNLTIGNGLTVIDEGTFYGCSGFTGTLTIGSSVQTIGKEAFKNCNHFTGNLSIPNSVTTLGQECFASCSGFDGTLTIGEGVATINPSPFNNCSGLTAIDYNAINATKPEWGNWLYGCNALATLTIGSNVESIFEGAFDGKTSLTGNLVIPNSVTTIEKNAFKGCSGFNGTLTLSNNLTSIGEAAFKDCTGFTGTLTIPSSLTAIDNEAFRNCHSITGNLVIPTGILTIGNDAFRDCYGLNGSLTIASSVTNVGTYSIANTRFTTIYYNAINADLSDGTWLNDCNTPTTLAIGSQVQVIPDNAFKNKRFEGQLVIPNSVTSIGAGAFYNNDYFTGDLVIPNSVAIIGNSAFQDCGGFNGTLTLPATMTSIGEAAFRDCRNITGTLTLPAGLVTIEKEAFREMSSLTGNLVIPNSVQEIKQQAFVNCRGLNGTLTLGTSLETIGQEAFQDCNNLTGNLIFPSTLTTLGNRAFKWCRGFTGDLEIPNSVTSLGEGVFYECYRFNGGLRLPNTLEVIPYEAFRGCYGLTGDLVIPNSVTTINASAFYNCSGFTGQLVIGESVVTLNNEAFNYSTNFTSLKVKRSAPPTINNSNVFDHWTKTLPVYVPCDAAATYQAADYWSDFNNYQEQPMIDLFVASDDDSMGTAAITQQPTCANNQATVTATANTGFMFLNWTEGDEVVSTSNPYTFSLTAARNLVAHFDGITYEITATANPAAGGTVTGAGSYGEGAEATLTATANTGYTFVNWTKGGVEVSTNPSYSFTVTENGAYVANFSLNSYEITASADPAAGGTVTGDNTYDYGTVATLTATANTGYTFVNWTKGGVEVSTDPSYNFTVTEDAAYVAHFSLNSYTIAATANPSAQGTVTGAGSYYYGAICTLTAAPNQGYRFVNWTENNVEVSTNSTYAFTVSGARTLVANFEEITNHWTPQTGEFEDYMALTCVIQIDGVEQHSNYLEVGAFCDNQCRGSKMAVYWSTVPELNRYVVYLQIYGQSGESINFKLFDHNLNQELDLTSPSPVTWTTNTASYHELNPYILNFTSTVNISANVDPIGAGTVTGTGEHAIGSTCTLSAIANTGFQFKNWTLEGTIVSIDATFSFTVTEPALYSANFEYVHSQSLANGWNWWSTYIELTGDESLTMLENSLGNNADQIKSWSDGYVNRIEYYGYVFWSGSLSSIYNDEMYMINANQACVSEITGNAVSLEDVQITLNPGWNWIGFPCLQNLSVSNALTQFDPQPNDMIKGRNGYASYITYGSYSFWSGSLNTLVSGQGYKYYSNSNTSKTVTYNTERENITHRTPNPENGYYTTKSEKYAHNMTVTAVIDLEGKELRSENYEIAAFVGNECRGSAKLMYVEPLDRYLAFLLVFGEKEESVSFVLTDGKGENWSEIQITYNNDGMVGTVSKPFVLDFGSHVMNDVTTQVNVYPNPSNGVFDIKGKDMRKIEILDSNGHIILSKETENDHIVINLNKESRGIYLLRVITDNGIKPIKLIKK